MVQTKTLEEIKDKKISNDQSPGGGQARGCSDDITKTGTVFWYTIFPSRPGNGRNVCIHPAAVEASWVVLLE